MQTLLILVFGFAFTSACCELLVRPRKLQSALGRIAMLHGLVLTSFAGFLGVHGMMRPVPVAIFWSGALLFWFGFRSHIESSILLRMIHLLGRNPMTRDQLSALYNARDGRAARVDELIRAGLVSRDRGRKIVVPTRKGLMIARLVLWLR